jgi:signal transduction histidine kinase
MQQTTMDPYLTARRRRPGLVGTFALASLVAFAGIGVAITVLTNRQVTRAQELDAQHHAQFVTDSLLAQRLRRVDVTKPLRGKRYRSVDEFIRARVLMHPVVRVKIWNLQGKVVYSDERRLVGVRFPHEPEAEARDGEVESEISDLSDPENRFERTLAPKLFSTYVPLYTNHKPGRHHPDAVVELYQNYASVEAVATRLTRDRLITLGAGLILLYVLLFPIVLGTSRRLRRQNQLLEDQARKLREQARRLERHLSREQQSVAELRTLSQMKSDFVAVASHELRSPLTAILGYVKTLRRPEFENDQTARREFLAAIERQGERLLRLVNNLLTTALVENRATTIEVSRFDVGPLLEEVKEGFHAGSRVELTIPEGIPPLESDRIRLSEILANLVDNALKYSPDEAPVELGARVADHHVQFWVLDRGVGIAPDDVERIFDRFYQTDQSITRRFGGVGLGLHLVRELAASLGGEVRVDSTPGAGSTFTLTMPLRAPIQAPRRPDVASGDGKKTRWRKVSRSRRRDRDEADDPAPATAGAAWRS